MWQQLTSGSRLFMQTDSANNPLVFHRLHLHDIIMFAHWYACIHVELLEYRLIHTLIQGLSVLETYNSYSLCGNRTHILCVIAQMLSHIELISFYYTNATTIETTHSSLFVEVCHGLAKLYMNYNQFWNQNTVKQQSLHLTATKLIKRVHYG